MRGPTRHWFSDIKVVPINLQTHLDEGAFRRAGEAIGSSAETAETVHRPTGLSCESEMSGKWPSALERNERPKGRMKGNILRRYLDRIGKRLRPKW